MTCYCMQTCFSIFTIKDCALNKCYDAEFYLAGFECGRYFICI